MPLAPLALWLQTVLGGSVVRACVLRLVAAAIPAPLLCACASDPYVRSASTAPSGNWRIERQLDRVTGAPIDSAFVTTRTSSNSSAILSQPATLQLGCFLGKPVVTFAFAFKVGTNLNSFLGYRFDEKPGHEIGARFVQNSSSVVIEEPAEVAQFVSELSTSKLLYIRIRSINAGRTAAEFDVDGAPAAIQSAFAHCPVRPAAPAPRTASLPLRRGAH